MTAKIDEIGYIVHAENLGFTHAWVTDSPMIRSNCWAVLGGAGGRVVGEARTVLVGFDYERGESVPISARWREALAPAAEARA